MCNSDPQKHSMLPKEFFTAMFKKYLRVRQLREKRYDVVHKMLIVDDGILTLLDQQLDKVTEAAAELFPKLTWKDISVLVNVMNFIPLALFIKDWITPHLV